MYFAGNLASQLIAGLGFRGLGLRVYKGLGLLLWKNNNYGGSHVSGLVGTSPRL